MFTNMTKEQQKERIRQRVRAQVDEEHYFFFPETVETDRFRIDEYQRAAVYARVSTDDTAQTSSFELQKTYYEEFIRQHEKWELVKIYADEGISGTSLKHRDAFNEMMADAKAGKIDLIITKSVSRFARNARDFLDAVRVLAEHNPPIGIFFESENIYSLRTDTSMPLTLYASMAEEESRAKSRSMETSLRMRLDHGLPLTPKLLGFDHDENGKLIMNPETYRIPKLMFYMCLFGYSTQQIADKLTKLGKKTYLGNVKWTANGVVETLRNERYCGDVFTRKTFTRDVLSHKSVKNRGERPRSRYLDEHEAIVTRDDFAAVQMLLNNSKYRNKSLLPELEVITDGLLKGFVIINPRWGSFTAEDYLKASAAAYGPEGPEGVPAMTVEADEGDFDFSGYEIAQIDLIPSRGESICTIDQKSVIFNADCISRTPAITIVELLVHPTEKKLAVRQADPQSRNAVRWAQRATVPIKPKPIAAAAFAPVILSLFDWDPENRYRLIGRHFQHENESVVIFSTSHAAVMINENRLQTASQADPTASPLIKRGKRIGAVAGNMVGNFGRDFYEEQTMAELIRQTPENWKIRLKGRLYDSGSRLSITPYEELKAFIQEELGELFWEDDTRGQKP